MSIQIRMTDYAWNGTALLSPGDTPSLDGSVAADLVNGGKAMYISERESNKEMSDVKANVDPVTGGIELSVGGKTYLTKNPNTIILFGDSITDYNNDILSNALNNATRGYWTWANTFLGRKRLHMVVNAGIGGDTTTQMLARIEADVLAYDSGWVAVLGGINDLAGNLDSGEVVIDNLLQIYSRILARGRKVLALTIMPVTAAHANFSLQLINRINRVNQWMRAFAAETPGMHLVDAARIVVDPASTNGDVRSGYYANATHPATKGAFYVGKEIARVLGSVIVEINDALYSDADDYVSAQSTLTSLSGDGTTATATLAGHKFKIGDTVTVEGATPSGFNGTQKVLTVPSGSTFTYACVESGSATGTIKASNGLQLLDNGLFLNPTSGLAANWTKVETGGTAVATNAAASDGIGNAQQLACTFTSGGNILLRGGDLITRVYAGDRVYLECEVEVDAGATTLEAIQLNLSMIVGGVTYIPMANYRLTGSVAPSDGWSGLLRTETFTIPAGAVTRNRPELVVYSSAAGSITARFLRARYVKVVD